MEPVGKRKEGVIGLKQCFLWLGFYVIACVLKSFWKKMEGLDRRVESIWRIEVNGWIRYGWLLQLNTLSSVYL